MFKNLSLEEIYWALLFGKPKHKASIYKLREKAFKDVPPPIFFLSTGRTGTKWFSNLFSDIKGFKVLHSPKPDLAIQNKLAYELINKELDTDLKENFLKELFIVAREQYLRYSYKSEKTIIETNNHITFFAPVLYQLFPNAKFVHLYRHPGEFVRSGIRREWYIGDNEINNKLIVSNAEHTEWKNYSQLQKISWLWCETNAFIEKFHTDNPEALFTSFNFNELNKENVEKLCDFLGFKISGKKISKALGKKVNVQSKGNVSEYSNWTDKQKQELNSICSSLASKYNYSL